MKKSPNLVTLAAVFEDDFEREKRRRKHDSIKAETFDQRQILQLERSKLQLTNYITLLLKMNLIQKTLFVLFLTFACLDSGSLAYTVSKSSVFSEWQKFLIRLFSSNIGNVRHIRPLPREACPEFNYPKVPDAKL